MGDVHKQGKEKQEGGLHRGTYTKKEEKSRREAYTRGRMQTGKGKAVGSLNRERKDGALAVRAHSETKT